MDIGSVFGKDLPSDWKASCEEIKGDRTFWLQTDHYRRKKGSSQWGLYRRGHTAWEPARKGGLTVCALRDQSGHMVSVGYALCALCDLFDYKEGRSRARRRAVFGGPTNGG